MMENEKSKTNKRTALTEAIKKVLMTASMEKEMKENELLGCG